MNRGKFLKDWQDKIIEGPFFKWLKSRKIIIGFQKFMNAYKGMCMSGGKFLKEWQVTDKIIEWNSFPILFNLLNDSNSKNNNSGFQKFTNAYEGMCMSEGKFLKPWQVTDKIIEWIFFQFTFNLLQMTQTKIITCRVSKINQMDRRGCVWVGKVS